METKSMTLMPRGFGACSLFCFAQNGLSFCVLSPSARHIRVQAMTDQFGRTINYLRLSVTDLCNLRCSYCMPAEGVRKRPRGEALTVEETVEVARAAAACGITKVRLTGGEPLVRRGILEICREIAALPGITEVCMTTNGILLPRFAGALKAAGLSRLNISLDTLDAGKYREITRMGALEDALAGIRAAREAGFSPIKLNVVLMGGINDDEICDFVALTEQEAFEVRFIELMPIGQCAGWAGERFVKGAAVLRAMPRLQEAGTDGVAGIYRIPGWKGSVGLITPMSRHFCGACSRIRITADGTLKSCLHSAGEVRLKGLSGEGLQAAIRAAVLSKPERHRLSTEQPSDSLRAMHEIGG